MSAKRSDRPRKLTIGEVAARTGVAASALRYYEREGLLPPADRSAGRRVWNADVVDRLALIDVAKAAGLTLAEIHTLLCGFDGGMAPGARWRVLAERKRSELAARRAEIERMQRVLEATTRCDCPTLEACARAVREVARAGP